MTDELVRLLAGYGHGVNGLESIQTFLGRMALTERLGWLATNILTPALSICIESGWLGRRRRFPRHASC